MSNVSSINPAQGASDLPKDDSGFKMLSLRTMSYIGIATILNTTVVPGIVGGGIVATANLIKGIWNVAKLGIQLASKASHEKAAKYNTCVLKGDSGEAIKHLNTLMNSNNNSEIEKTKADIKKNFHAFVGGILSAVPFCGILASDAYLGKMHGTSYRLGLSKEGTEVTDLFPASFQLAGLFYPRVVPSYNGKELKTDDVEEMIQIMCEDIPNTTVEKVKVERGVGDVHELNVVMLKPKDSEQNNKTMVLFHGNGCVGPQMQEEALMYKKLGWNVAIVTMGGYPGSGDENVKTNEASSIQDVNAILQHLEKKGVESIGVHGFSIGGSVAMHATKLSNKVDVVVLDKTFDNATNVAVNLLKNNFLGSLLPSSLVRGVVNAGIPKEQLVYGVKDKDGKDYSTDGCDNLAKVRAFQGHLVCIGGDQDLLMGQKKGDDGIYASNFSNKLALAHPDQGKVVNEIVNAPHVGIGHGIYHLATEKLANVFVIPPKIENLNVEDGLANFINNLLEPK